jgi:hypothetical protein
MHAPHADDEQHTPSTQFPVPHSLPATQACPAVLRHLLVKQA